MPRAAHGPAAVLDTHDVQGLVASGYADHPAAAYVLLEVVDAAAARTWLASLAEVVTAADGPVAAPCTNVALTARGLRRLGVPPGDLRTFPLAFRQGARHRAGRLGDAGPNDPAGWRWGGAGAEVDVVVLLYAGHGGELEELVAAALAAASEACAPVAVLRARDREVDREAFGFRDGIAQPERHAPPPHHGHWPHPLERFVLGAGAGPGAPPIPTLAGEGWGRNGTYLVLRELEQDVVAFHDLLDRLASVASPGGRRHARSAAAAKLMGRWPDGTPLVTSPAHPSEDDAAHRDDFDYDADPDGLRCPIGAHVRRANPRRGEGLLRSDRHRLVRRGRPFGPSPADGVDRPDHTGAARCGLYFIALCADLEEQFEFVQRAWCLEPSFQGLHDETDPLVGWSPDGTRRFTVPDPLVARRWSLPHLVTTRGSLYAFLPSRAALAALPGLVAQG